MKRVLAVLLSLSMAMGLMACGGKEAPAAPPAAEGQEEEQASQAEGEAPAEVYKITAALHTNAGAIEDQTFQVFKEKVEAATNGGITVDVFAGASLGTEQENLTQIKTGEIQMALFGDVFLAQMLGEYNATSIPFVFPDIESVEAYWASIEEEVDKTVLENGNMLITGRQRRAPRMLTAGKEILHPSDLSGFKLRVPETEFYMTVWGALGAITTPVNFSELYTALQTNVVDGQENPIETNYSAGLQEVQEYTMLTSHINTHYTWAVNADFYNSLPEEYKEAFDKACEEALSEVNAGLEERQNAIVEEMEAAGHTFVEVDYAEWQAAAMDGIKKCMETLSPTAQEAVKQYLPE
ncbi:solute-binding protein [Lachnospiraceae bacterium]|nr:solute-binding protein [Lachnospiraceae bacterium]